MTSRAALGRHTRPKKLNAKQSIQIFREGDVDPIDFDIRSTIETGVEKNEESVSIFLLLPNPATFRVVLLPRITALQNMPAFLSRTNLL